MIIFFINVIIDTFIDPINKFSHYYDMKNLSNDIYYLQKWVFTVSSV